MELELLVLYGMQIEINYYVYHDLSPEIFFSEGGAFLESPEKFSVLKSH